MFIFKDIVFFQNLSYYIYYENLLDSCFSLNTLFNIENMEKSYGIFLSHFPSYYPVTDQNEFYKMFLKMKIKFQNSKFFVKFE